MKAAKFHAQASDSDKDTVVADLVAIMVDVLRQRVSKLAEDAVKILWRKNNRRIQGRI